jgi:hypothetical protein
MKKERRVDPIRSAAMKNVWKRKGFRKRMMVARKEMYSSLEWRDRCGVSNKGRAPWNKGETKETHPSILHMSKVREEEWRTNTELTDKRVSAIREVCATPEWKKKSGESHLGKPSWSAGKTKETHPSLAELSRRFRGRIPRWNGYVCYYEGQNGRVRMRSSWEVKFAEWCDGKGFEWEYEPAFFIVGKGDWDGETYTPDFYLPVIDCWIDIKGFYSNKNRRKIQAFINKFSDLHFWLLRKKHLRVLGVDLRKAA